MTPPQDKTYVIFRYSDNDESTLGLFFDWSGESPRFLCHTLEDEHREEKVFAETRIPAGAYRVKLRSYGGHHDRYSNKFPRIHVGMLEVMDVPGFTDILVHCGNDDDDTAGCLLLGETANSNIPGVDGFVGSSVAAYKRVYPEIAKVLMDGGRVTFVYKDMDRMLLKKEE